MSARRRLGKSVVALVVVAVVGVGGFLGLRAGLDALIGPPSPRCTFGAFDTTTDQAATAARMTSVVIRRDLPERAAVLVLAAALQESKLRNIASGAGDRDSVGVLQQRPSQGWGSAAKLADPQYATGKFLDKLVKVDGWRTGELSDVIQKVQISADGSLYAQHAEQAQAMADALTGATAQGVRCRFDKPTAVARTATVAKQIKSDLKTAAPSVSGTRLTVGKSTGKAGWRTAAWLVSNGDRLGVEQVRYAGRRWQRDTGKWKADSSADATSVVATMYR